MIYYPPEWLPQRSLWLSFPHNDNEWQEAASDGLQQIQSFYRELIVKVLDYQNIDLIFHSKDTQKQEQNFLDSLSAKKFSLNSHVIAHNDIWIRDYGPFFVKNDKETEILNFEFNAWGEKFPPWDLDNKVPLELASRLAYKSTDFDFILEGGALEFNGAGVLMTTKQCLLNPNRNPKYQQEEIEEFLKRAFNLDKILWLERGLEGDHTDGHIDDFARFISDKKILVCQSDDPKNPNYEHLRESAKYLTQQGFELDFLPLPKDMKRSGEYLPASYANFILLNGAVLIPSFNCAEDDLVQEVFTRNFPSRKVLSIDSSFLIQEGGGLHCMTKQEPL